jgi:hypothetical protein
VGLSDKPELARTKAGDVKPGELTFADELRFNKATGEFGGVSKKSRSFLEFLQTGDLKELRKLVERDVQELIEKYSGAKFLREPAFFEKAGAKLVGDPPKIAIANAVLMYDLKALPALSKLSKKDLQELVTTLAQQAARKHGKGVKFTVVFR